MKNIKHILLIVLLVAFSACEKHELMDYEGQDCLYFDAQYGASWGDTTVWAHQIYSTIAFGRVDALVLDAKVKVAVAGSIKDYERQGRAPKEITEHYWQVDDPIGNKFGYIEGLE